MPLSFSNVKYAETAPYFWLDPGKMGDDIRKLEVFRSRLPMDVFREIYRDVRKASLQYGRMQYHSSEEARSLYIASVSRTKFPIRLNLFMYLFILISDVLPASMVYAGLTVYRLPLAILPFLTAFYYLRVPIWTLLFLVFYQHYVFYSSPSPHLLYV